MSSFPFLHSFYLLLISHAACVFYSPLQCLGEEYPEVLGSILGGLKSIVAVIGMGQMQPPIKDLLPRLTPILKNRAEEVRSRGLYTISCTSVEPRGRDTK